MYIGRLYPARFKQAPDGGYIVTFRDIPEFDRGVENTLDGICVGVYYLHAYSEYCLKNGKSMPEPSASEPGEILIPLYIDDEQRAFDLFGESMGG